MATLILFSIHHSIEAPATAAGTAPTFIYNSYLCTHISHISDKTAAEVPQRSVAPTIPSSLNEFRTHYVILYIHLISLMMNLTYIIIFK